MTTKETVPAIHAAMAAVMSGLEAIGKDKRNEQQKFKYRGIDDVYNALHPLLAANKIVTLPRVLEIALREDRVTRNGGNLTYTIAKVEYDFISGVDGSKVTVGPLLGEGMDAADKSCAKAMAIAHKYALFQTFCIPTEDAVDPDATAYDIDPPEKAKPQGEPAKPKAAAKKAAPKKESAPVQQDDIVINDAQGATEAADFIISFAEGASTMSGLASYWRSNKKLIDLLDHNYPEEYTRVKTVFTNQRAKLEEQS